MSDPLAPAVSAPLQSRWLRGLAPLVLLGVLVAVFLRFGPVGVLRQGFPPVEELTVERITLPHPGEMRVRVVNGGPEPVTIAQVFVDDASWNHTLDGDRTIGRLDSRDIIIPYPWVHGEPVTVRVVTSTGVTFAATLDVATQTPKPDAQYLGTFALLGIYVGVIPVFLGLLWLPFLRAIHRKWLDFFLCLTVGLLVFLGVDALAEALATATRVPSAFQGLGLVLIGALGTPLLLNVLSHRHGNAVSGMRLSGLIALAIGLHNFGEGLAVGAAYASGAIALGAFLVLGFLLHNTTEGLGIVAPLAREKPRLSQLLLLGLLAGAPTIAGAWIGGFSYSPLWTTFFFAIGVGAIAQVAFLLGRRYFTASGLTPLNAAGLVLGLAIMYVTGLLVTA